MNLLISILGILITIFLVVGIHEFGHFIVARMCGIKVLRFSIGFGKSLYHWHDKKGTEYVLAAIPLGGYVKMVDEMEENVSPADLPYAFNRQPIYKKILVIIAGPLFNLVFAFLLYWLLFMIGFTTIKPLVGSVLSGSIADKAGIKPQQEIIQIDQYPTRGWTSVIIKIFERAGDTNQMQVQTLQNQIEQNHILNLSSWHMDELKPDPLESLGIKPYEPLIPTVIAMIKPDSPAALSGLKIGDQILSVENKPTKDWMTLVELISEKPGATLKFEVLRNHQKITLPVVIGVRQNFLTKKTGYLGLLPQFEIPKDLLRFQQYGPLTAIPQALMEVHNFTVLNFIIFGKLILGKVSLKSLGGPISIFETAGTALNHGMIPFMSFLAFLSISIGVINIFPIPGLDGGHFLFQVIEFIRGKPLSERTQLLMYRIGMIFILLLIVQALTNDILRL